MKRDWDTIRKLLETIEEATTALTVLTDRDISKRAGIDTEQCLYHIRLLADAGLIEADCIEHMLGGQCTVRRLTWAGHEMLDTIRSDTVWAMVKRRASELGISLTLNTASKLAAMAIDSLTGGRP